MKKISFLLLLFIATYSIANAQKENRSRLGIKGGYNWSYLTGNEQGINKESKTGFMVSAFYSANKKRKGYRTELVFSRQGYSFDDGGKNTDVLNDYVYLPQLVTFGIGKFMQLQAGGQVGYLVNAKVSSATKDSSIINLMNRFDYGFAGGLEIYPFKGLLVGGRYNLGLGKLYKRFQQPANANPYPLPFNPETTDFRNGVFQLFVGYRF